MKEPQRQGVSTTALRTLRALEVVSGSEAPLSSRELAERMSCDKVTAYRMLLTLEAAGYLLHDTVSNKYCLSSKVVSLGRNLLAENETSRMVTQIMRELSAATHETLHYSVLDGDRAVLVNRIKGSQLVVVDFQLGDRAELHCTSIGKVLLAYQDLRLVERVIAQGLPERASNTITDPAVFRAELAKIRARGYAIDDHEFSDNMRCVAVPIIYNGGTVNSGLSISGPDSRFTLKKLSELSELLVEASVTLSRSFGGIP
ncbi:MAG TPA: IclR family transcriptional regulator [Magnetospirillaceae bacterium]|nr:IclR family transcriptional regulator [Magnetospirillaceae bacterium]